MTRDCTDCTFSRIDLGDPDGPEGFVDGPLMRCHRYPPVVVSYDGEIAQTWPNVDRGDWCGEWTPDRETTRD